jgi:pyruvate/2-oxoglutarate dehydrogenase complex dihydrolipoamide acyltransferase (E2) component
VPQALRDVPEVNSAWMGDFIRQYDSVNVSVAVQTPHGLMVPVVPNTDALGLQDINAAVKQLAGKVRPRFQGWSVGRVEGFAIEQQEEVVCSVGPLQPVQLIMHDALHRYPDTCRLCQSTGQGFHHALQAKDNKLKPDEMTGGTFTISNLGMFGVDQFAAIINPPQAGHRGHPAMKALLQGAP